MKDGLIPTNGVWYRIKHFLKNIFGKEKKYNTNEENMYGNKVPNNNIPYNDNLKARFETEREKQALAEKLLYGEIGTSELNDDEVDEMTEYFTKDIENIDNELLKIKQHIMAIKQQLQKQN